MSIPQAVAVGLAGNEISKKITGTSEVSSGRTVIATASGGAVGAVASGTVAVGASAFGFVVAPVAVPLTVAGAVIGGIASLFDN